MTKGRDLIAMAVALAVMLGSLAPVSGVAAEAWAAKSAAESGGSGGSAKKRYALHQFTGTVVAMDKTSLTVEKPGKTPQTRVFTRWAEMKTMGTLEKDARVTVYYRDEDGRSVARKVVVKEPEADEED